MKIQVDVLYAHDLLRVQNDLIRSAGLFEEGNVLAKYQSLIIDGNPQLKTLCQNIADAHASAGGYAIFVGIKSIDGIRTENPLAYIKTGVQSLSMCQNGQLGWILFKDALRQLEYVVETDEHIIVKSVQTPN